MLKELLDDIKTVLVESIKSGEQPSIILESLDVKWNQLSEKLNTVFEALSNERALNLTEEAKAEFQKELETKFDEEIEKLSNKITAYLNEAHEAFVKEYKGNIVSESKVALVENFYNALKTTFNENGIEVDTSAASNIDSLNEELKVLKTKLDESINKNIDLQSKMAKTNFQMTMESVKHKHNLSDVDYGRLTKLATSLNESIDTKVLEEKLTQIVESVVKANTSVKGLDSVTNEDTSKTERIEKRDSVILESEDLSELI